jgi:phosphonate transport system substrate-binding protein
LQKYFQKINLVVWSNWYLALFATLIFACTPKPSELKINYANNINPPKQEIRFGIHPLHNPEKLIAVFGPLADLLNAQIPEYDFKVEASRNYQTFEEKLKKRQLELALPNPYQTIVALKYGYRIFAKMGDDKNFRGLIIVRKDSKIKKLSDLKNKKISYPAATALAATMLPQFYFYQNGLDTSKETQNMYVGSQESSIMNAYMKESDAACTWPPPWISFAKNNPEKAKDLEVKWETQNLVNNGMIIRDDLPIQLQNRIQNILLHMHETEDGRIILARMELSRFESADEQTYQKVRNFITEFTKLIRNPEEEK